MNNRDQLITGITKELVELTANLKRAKLLEIYQKMNELPTNKLKMILKATLIIKEEVK